VLCHECREFPYSEPCHLKWSLNGGGLSIEVEMYGIATFGTGPSGL
jgi:hypothetical protein